MRTVPPSATVISPACTAAVHAEEAAVQNAVPQTGLREPLAWHSYEKRISFCPRCSWASACHDASVPGSGGPTVLAGVPVGRDVADIAVSDGRDVARPGAAAVVLCSELMR